MITEVVPAPQRIAPTETLFAAAESASTTGNRWQGGVRFVSDCGGSGILVPVCDPPDADAYAARPSSQFGEFETVEARAFEVWAGRECGTRVSDNEIVDLERSARQALALDRYRQMESEFWTGALAQEQGWDNPTEPGVAGQPFLTNTDTLVQVDTTGLPLVLGYGTLVAALGDCHATGRGFVHVSRRTLVSLVAAQVVRREGTQWRDPFDNIVVGGAGYDGSGPLEGEWLYATGPVEARFSTEATVSGTDPHEYDLATNRREVRASQYAGAWFDPCCHLGIVADLSGACGATIDGGTP